MHIVTNKQRATGKTGFCLDCKASLFKWNNSTFWVEVPFPGTDDYEEEHTENRCLTRRQEN